MIKVKSYFNILGKKVKDKVTGFKGIATSLSFDLYGCVQVVVNPGLAKDGKQGESGWYDIGRLEILSEKPVMDPPTFDFSSGNVHGPAEKPRSTRF